MDVVPLCGFPFDSSSLSPDFESYLDCFLIPPSVIFTSLSPQYLHVPMLSEPEADIEATVI